MPERNQRTTGGTGLLWPAAFRRFGYFTLLLAVLALGLTREAKASFLGAYAANQWTLTNSNADGTFSITPDGATLTLTGGNSGSGNFGTTDFVVQAAATGMVQFDYMYSSLDLPTFDFADYLGPYARGSSPQPLNFLSDGTANLTGTIHFAVTAGQSFGFRVGTNDNQGEPGVLQISNFTAPGGVSGNGVPEPGTATLLLVVLGAVAALRTRLWGKGHRSPRVLQCVALGIGFSTGSLLLAQTQVHYDSNGAVATGQVVLSRTVNVLQLAQQSQVRALLAGTLGPEVKPGFPLTFSFPHPLALPAVTALASPAMTSMAINPFTTAFGFMGLTHYDQRQANNGNQFSVEPPSQAIASGNGYVVEGVNNAIQVYTTSGTALLPIVLASNQLFGVSPAIDRTTGVNGVYPTDMRVVYLADIQRWIILQWSQTNDAAGNPLAQSQIYMAVSQGPDPTATYNIYTIDTTHASNPGCPCISDYPELGADQYGFYISTNEFTTSIQFRDAMILAISKASLASGSLVPTTYRFTIPTTLGYESTIQPATTPPGGAFFTASGGVEYFVSSQAGFGNTNNLAVWAMANTISLGTASPLLTLTQTLVPTLAYASPVIAPIQRSGPLPYGSSLVPPGNLAPLDGGDSRIQSLSYAGGRLYTTLITQVTDEDGHTLVGGAYVVITPTFRGGFVSGSALRQGYLMVRNNHLLRPTIAVNAQGKGAIVFTLMGLDYYPSAAFVPFDNFAPASTVQIAGTGVLPEDGFTGYNYPGVARWGDSSAAAVDSDGSVWMATEYIPNAPRTQLANWGTYVVRYTP